MASFLDHPGFWGFCAAGLRACAVAVNALWYAKPPPDERRRKYIIGQVVIAALLGPLVAEALTPSLADVLGRSVSFRAIALGLGFGAAYAPDILSGMVTGKGFFVEFLKLMLKSMGSKPDV